MDDCHAKTAGMKNAWSESMQFKTQSNLVVTTKSLEKDAAHLMDPDCDCQMRAREFEVTVNDDNAELTVPEEAKSVLLERSVLEQTHSQVRALAEVRVQDEDPKFRDLKSIEQLGRQLRSTTLKMQEDAL